MSHHSRLLRWLTLVIAAATLATAAHAAPRNILLLIADDFGIDSASLPHDDPTRHHPVGAANA